MGGRVGVGGWGLAKGRRGFEAYTQVFWSSQHSNTTFGKEYFSGNVLNPCPARGGARLLVGTGRRVFQVGVCVGWGGCWVEATGETRMAFKLHLPCCILEVPLREGGVSEMS